MDKVYKQSGVAESRATVLNPSDISLADRINGHMDNYNEHFWSLFK